MELDFVFIGINLEGFSFSIIQQHPIFPQLLDQTGGEKLHMSITEGGGGRREAHSHSALLRHLETADGLLPLVPDTVWTCPPCQEGNNVTHKGIVLSSPPPASLSPHPTMV